MIGAPSRLRLIRKAAALAEIKLTRDLSIEEKAARRKWKNPPVQVYYESIKRKPKIRGTTGFVKRVTPEFSPFHFFHFSLYQDGTKWVCTAPDVPGTKLLGEIGKEKTLGLGLPISHKL